VCAEFGQGSETYTSRFVDLYNKSPIYGLELVVSATTLLKGIIGVLN
jgi:hypothetical protein